MDKVAIKERIVALVNDFKANYQQHRKELEANTETKLIEPLFTILGWTIKDFEKRAHAQRGKKSGFVDYAFKINDKIVFLLEVKKLGVALEKEADSQVISYALSRRIPFAVSTNFEKLKIFCVEQENALNNVFRVFNRPEDYIDSIQDLLFLHKESFEQNLILKKAEDEGRLKKRISIDRPLLEDLMSIRNMIANDIEKRYPRKYELNEREEIIQRIVDRLIFVRKCEDVGINPDELTLEEITHNPYGKAHLKLKEIFKRYNEVYNGGLFAVGFDNDCDKITIDGEIVQKLIRLLYVSKDRQYVYNFDWIDADILGQVYEQYLGKILSQTRSGKSKLTNGQTHRKEQGIYYTPTYIVDYIVANTLGELLRNKKIDAKKIKVLDPACGSGSFLIKAFDYLKEHYYSNDADAKLHRLDEQGMYSLKTTILKNNIYGVDLDSKAVEITKLNLLLKAAEKFRTLPQDVELHIRHGNSLIDDESVAGMDAFKWQGDFQEGTFDAVIGNPPYVRIQTLDKNEVEYFNTKYKSPTKNYDIYILFIEKGFSLLKENGVLGLILPHKFFQGEMGENIRRYIYETKSLYKLVDFSTNQIFENATTYTCLLFLTKRKNKQFLYKRFKLGDDFRDLNSVDFEKKDSRILKENKWNFSSDKIQKILSKIRSQKDSFPSLTRKIFKGSSTGDDEIFLLDPIQENRDTFTVFSKKLNQNVIIEKALLRPFFHGEDIRRYAPLRNRKLLLFPYVLRNNRMKLIPVEEMKEHYHLAYSYLEGLKGYLIKRKIETNNSNFYKYSAPRSLIEYDQPKIMIPDMLVSNRIGYDEGGIAYHGPAIHSIVFNERIKEQKPILYLAILNSRIFWFFISNTSTALRGNAYRLTPEFVNPFCFPKFDLSKSQDRQIYDKLISLAEQMLFLYKRLNDIGDKKTSESAKIEEEIRKTDAEIDEIIYKTYGLTEEEIKIIEETIGSSTL